MNKNERAQDMQSDVAIEFHVVPGSSFILV